MNPYKSHLSILILGCWFLSLATLSRGSVQYPHNYFNFGAKLIPHPDKVEKGGEDAFFANQNVLAVADGVGGWTLQGIDPSKYSKKLCVGVGEILEEGNRYYVNNPKGIIAEAARRDPFEGSSTFVVTYLDKEQPILRTSYIGDSVYVIYRKVANGWRAFFEAEEQQRSFNFPYQLGNYGGDTPNMAVEFKHNVEENDIVVVASDGLFDNLWPRQVLQILLPFIGEDDLVTDPKAAAEALANTAFELSLNKNYNSPFAQRAAQAYLYFMGGKSDDITVIVGQVKLANKTEQTGESNTEKAGERQEQKTQMDNDEL